MNKPLLRPRLVTWVSLGLLFGGLLLDLTTRQDLVVAIVYNIPIAFSGLALSRSLTTWTIVLALVANIAAAYENALVFSSYDTTTLMNRSLAGLTFLLVGLMTLAVERAAGQVTELSEAENDAGRERTLRSGVNELLEAMESEELYAAAAHEVRAMLQADAVVITAVVDERFDEPRYAAGHAESLARLGTTASWAIDAIPVTDTPAITVRSDRGSVTSGKWRRDDGPDLIVLAERPKVDKPSVVLGETVRTLERLLRLIEHHRCRHGDGDAAPGGTAQETDGAATAS